MHCFMTGIAVAANLRQVRASGFLLDGKEMNNAQQRERLSAGCCALDSLPRPLSCGETESLGTDSVAVAALLRISGMQSLS